jgi:hypothetical protein
VLGGAFPGGANQRRWQAGSKIRTGITAPRTTHYDRNFFDPCSAHVFPGTPTDSSQAGWLDLKLIQLPTPWESGIGINDNRDSPSNMATLPGRPYSVTSPGCVYLVPVQASITTQARFFEVHENPRVKTTTFW